MLSWEIEENIFISVLKVKDNVFFSELRNEDIFTFFSKFKNFKELKFFPDSKI